MEYTQESEKMHAHPLEEETVSEHTHSHVMEDGTVIEHTHSHVMEDGTVIEHTHSHVMEDGTVIEHTHSQVMEDEMVIEQTHSHEHGHTHTHENTKAVLNRLSRAIGHLEYVKRMVEEGRDCSEVLIQLSAVKSALNNTGKIILQDHIKHCLVDAIQSGDMQEIEELNKAIDQFIK